MGGSRKRKGNKSMNTSEKKECSVKKPYFVILAIALLLFSGTSAPAADDLVQTVVDGCRKELETYCKDVGLR